MGATQQQLIALGGGGGGAMWTTLDPANCSTDITLSGGNLVATGNTGTSGCVRGANGKTTGKYYFEAVLTNAPSGGGADTIGVGVCNSSQALTGGSLGYSTTNGWALWGVTGSGYRHGGLVFGMSALQGDVLGFHVDLDNDRIWVSQNGVQLQGDPATGTSPLSTNLTGTIYPAACPWSISRIITMRFDPTTFSYTPATGFGGWPA